MPLSPKSREVGRRLTGRGIPCFDSSNFSSYLAGRSMASTRKYGQLLGWVPSIYPSATLCCTLLADIELRRIRPRSVSILFSVTFLHHARFLQFLASPSQEQSVSVTSHPRISMTDHSSENQENPIQSKTPVSYGYRAPVRSGVPCKKETTRTPEK
ncbi:uncharacterized protein BDZ83DRAFT_649371 [Colletotrichum acutatum]|uniref:Uncharacterized protein n=1 Tax=Glomerella acutata TaxID=27357 RepID=A0AAD8UUX6_GLOAC|nr:uncharacterized protein BDZ83DRAFT_649371 [Colletotrichum acutatum]KAK1727766.1 hypothetical protein BDZ83DRAFT_649371 [Colletotrichum acutatum]